MARPKRSYLHAAACALTLLASLVAGCHFPISEEVVYRPGRTAKPPRAEAKSDLVVGVRALSLKGLGGEPLPEEAGDARELGFRFAEALRDALVFQEVVYPLRDEEVDVILEPHLAVGLTKNRLTNALKVFPGIVMPWIDGLGFDYDHRARLAVGVRNPARDGVLCAVLRAEAAMTAERYPSVLWFLGIHVGLFILLVFESVTTDQLVLERLQEQVLDEALAPVVTRIVEGFTPVAKPCPLHPGEEQVGRYCIVCGRDLFYPLLHQTHRGDAAEGAAADR